jgi:hypothetical protein
MRHGATEFSVSRLPGSSLWVQAQSRGFDDGRVAVRFSAELTGPFGELCDVYLPPEKERPGLLLYAGKAHPQLKGADLIATYVANTLDANLLMNDTRLYYPRFIRIDGQRLRDHCHLP